MKVLKVSITALFFFCLGQGMLLGQQNYGLIYRSFNVPQENRTSIEIGTTEPVCLKQAASLSFELRFQPDKTTYYGYVFRLINNKGQNVDLIYNQKDDIFNVVLGARFTDINFKLPAAQLYNSWTKLSFNFSGDELQCYINGKLSGQTKAVLTDRCFKMIFGASRIRGFSTTDVPPMQIRNIGITEKGSLAYFWPLDNVAGEDISDTIRGVKGRVVNPEWAGVLHRKWQKKATLKVKGNASYTFDPVSEQLVIVSEDTVMHLPAADLAGARRELPSKDYHLFQGNLSLYNTVDNKLYNYYIDNKGLAFYDPGAGTWSQRYDTLENTAYGHASRVFISKEAALYIFGGYGQLRYKNEVQRVDFARGDWKTISVAGDYFAPRYMAGVGTALNSIYIFGGYGSQDGDQRLNPRHYYDLMRFDLKTRRFKKLYTLPDPETPFVPAGSLVIDSAEGAFYSLVYDDNRFDTKLQLIRGSLSSPTYTPLADPISYSFKDVTSDADLFYAPSTKTLMAVTQLTDLGNSTQFEIYTISFPADLAITEGGNTAQKAGRAKWQWQLLLGVLSVLLLLGLGFLLGRRKKAAGKQGSLGSTDSNKTAADLATAAITTTSSASASAEALLASDRGAEEPKTNEKKLSASQVANQDQPLTGAVPSAKEAVQGRVVKDILIVDSQELIDVVPETGLRVFLFGSFEMRSDEGEEISQQFSPLLKELFLMILLYTVKDGKGISTNRINDIFWGNKTGKNAKNNLSVNMVRLKAILSKAGDILIKKEGDRWICDYASEQVWIDLVAFLALLGDRQLKGIHRVRHMMAYISKGAFLKQTEYGWLDEIKADINNKAIDELLKESRMLDEASDVEYIIEIANNIFHFDPLNEDALQLKCRSLYRIGRHSLAQHCYERFAKEFQRIYDEPFSISFNEIVK